MSSSSDLAKKHMLLKSFYPGINVRNLSQFRYVQMKLGIQRSVPSHKGRKHSLPDIQVRNPIDHSIEFKRKYSQPISFLTEPSQDASFPDQMFCHRGRPQPIDLSTFNTESIKHKDLLRQKNAISGLWVQKIKYVNYQVKRFENVCKRPFQSGLGIPPIVNPR